MAVRSGLLEETLDYLRGHVALDALDMWLAQHAQELARLDDSDPMARLSGLIEVTLAEIDDGVATKADLDFRIGHFLAGYLEGLTASTDSLNRTAEPLGGEVVIWSTTESPQTVEHIAA
jgi:hypothetical protein